MTDTTPQKCRYDADRPCWQQEGGHFNEWCEQCQWNYTTAEFRKTIDTLRAELAGAQADLSAVSTHMTDVTEELHRQLAARDAEVPGLSTTPGYTMDDVDRIEAARGRPYVKLRETVVLADAARDIHSMSAATGNETKEVES